MVKVNSIYGVLILRLRDGGVEGYGKVLPIAIKMGKKQANPSGSAALAMDVEPFAATQFS